MITDVTRELVVQAAESQVGLSDPKVYWRNVVSFKPPYPKEWCGAFALWCLHQAGLGLDVNWRVGFGFLYRLRTTKKPKVGDVAYFERFQHHSVIRSVDLETSTFCAVNGNGSGGKVTLGAKQPLSKAAAFYSIQRWIDEVDES